MPKRKRDVQKGSKRSKRRKTSSKKKSSTKATNTLVLGGSNRIMPEVFHNIMEVKDTTNTVLGSAGLSVGFNYNANGLYDYATSLGNPSVPGFEFLAPIYRFYKVKGFRIKVTAVNLTALPVYLNIAMQPGGSTAFTTWADFRQLTSNKWAKEVLVGRSQSGNDMKTLTMYVPFKDYIGKDYDTDNDWSGTTNSGGMGASNPAKIVSCYVRALSGDGFTVMNPTTFNVNTELTYYVQWYGLAPLPS